MRERVSFEREVELLRTSAEGPADSAPRLLLRRTGVVFKQRAAKGYDGLERRGFRYLWKDGWQYYYNVERGPKAMKVVEGYRGKLIVRRADGTVSEWDCIERGNGFRHLSDEPPHAGPRGKGSQSSAGRRYTGTFIIRPDRTGKKAMEARRAIRVEGQVLVHPAAFPCDLDGCVAPGKEMRKDYGVTKSRAAFAEIIEALGGWAGNKKVQIEIRGFKTRAG
jgi:hypothetical protein